jgi:hypothetical protein
LQLADKDRRQPGCEEAHHRPDGSGSDLARQFSIPGHGGDQLFQHDRESGNEGKDQGNFMSRSLVDDRAFQEVANGTFGMSPRRPSWRRT